MGIQAARPESQRRLRVDHPHHTHAEDYQPTPPGVLDDMLCPLDLDPAGHTFIDLGAGKGRVLCLAAAYPFRRIVGVELIPALVEACRSNLEQFAAPWAQCRDLSVVSGDAATFAFPDEPLVIYLYNPFRAPVMRGLQRNLRATHADRPRPIWLLYYMPVYRQHFDQDAAFGVIDEGPDWVTYRLR